jgi:hypothetical protein
LSSSKQEKNWRRTDACSCAAAKGKIQEAGFLWLPNPSAELPFGWEKQIGGSKISLLSPSRFPDEHKIANL